MIYDVIVLGGGPGGYMAAEKAGGAGLKTLLIEKVKLGGVCLNEGCIPTKTLLNSAKLYEHCTEYSTPYGVTCSEPVINHEKVLARKDKVVKMLVGGIGMQMKQHHVEVIIGEGVIIGKKADVVQVEVNGETYEAKDLIIATGSSPAVPPIEGVREGIESGFVETSHEILDDAKIPTSMVVIGAGVIGLEIASYYNMLGCKVTMIEMLDKIAGTTEKDISKELEKIYKAKGIQFILGAKVCAVSTHSVIYELDGESREEDCERVLLSVGRSANTKGLGLEKIGVEVDRGGIVTDDCCRTNIEHVYAIGDVNGKVMLAHTAYREAECTVHMIREIEDRVAYELIPSVIYTNPEVGSVGYTEEGAQAAGYADVETVKLPMSYSGRYVAENERGTGFAKFLFDRKSKTMIGAHMISNYSSEFLVACSVLISLRVPMEEMRRLVFPHPTVGEIIREAIHTSKL